MPLSIKPDKASFEPPYIKGQGGFALPFAEQIAFFKGKAGVLLPSEHWDDILNEAHDTAFMVAGATKADLLTDFYNAVEKATAEGKSLKWFQKEFDNIVATHGWDYKGTRDWRSRVIYSTNLSTSYAAGRWAQLHHPDLLKNRPYWQYVHSDLSVHPRQQHLAWNGLVLRYDDGFWDTHFPPNGFGCRCRITAVREPAGGVDTAPDNGTWEKVDSQGEVHTLPKGVDLGFGYAPGKSVWKPDPANYPMKIGEALGKDLAGQKEKESAILADVKKVYDTAKSGGKHGGFYRNNLDLPTAMIERGIKTMEKRIAEHRALINDPYIKIPRDTDPRQVAALVGKKWPGDIARITEEMLILQGIIEEKKVT